MDPHEWRICASLAVFLTPWPVSSWGGGGNLLEDSDSRRKVGEGGDGGELMLWSPSHTPLKYSVPELVHRTRRLPLQTLSSRSHFLCVGEDRDYFWKGTEERAPVDIPSSYPYRACAES